MQEERERVRVGWLSVTIFCRVSRITWGLYAARLEDDSGGLSEHWQELMITQWRRKELIISQGHKQ